MIAKHEFSKGQWDELSQFIMQHCQSPEPVRREVSGCCSPWLPWLQACDLVPPLQVGLLLLSSLMESATVQVGSENKLVM